MHPHHARALRVARRNYKASCNIVEGRRKLYLRCREAYIYNVYTQGLAPNTLPLSQAVDALQLALEVQLDALAVLETVERLLANA